MPQYNVATLTLITHLNRRGTFSTALHGCAGKHLPGIHNVPQVRVAAGMKQLLASGMIDSVINLGDFIYSDGVPVDNTAEADRMIQEFLPDIYDADPVVSYRMINGNHESSCHGKGPGTLEHLITKDEACIAAVRRAYPIEDGGEIPAYFFPNRYYKEIVRDTDGSCFAIILYLDSSRLIAGDPEQLAWLSHAITATVEDAKHHIIVMHHALDHSFSKRTFAHHAGKKYANKTARPGNEHQLLGDIFRSFTFPSAWLICAAHDHDTMVIGPAQWVKGQLIFGGGGAWDNKGQFENIPPGTQYIASGYGFGVLTLNRDQTYAVRSYNCDADMKEVWCCHYDQRGVPIELTQWDPRSNSLSERPLYEHDIDAAFFKKQKTWFLVLQAMLETKQLSLLLIALLSGQFILSDVTQGHAREAMFVPFFAVNFTYDDVTRYLQLLDNVMAHYTLGVYTEAYRQLSSLHYVLDYISAAMACRLTYPAAVDRVVEEIKAKLSAREPERTAVEAVIDAAERERITQTPGRGLTPGERAAAAASDDDEEEEQASNPVTKTPGIQRSSSMFHLGGRPSPHRTTPMLQAPTPRHARTPTFTIKEVLRSVAHQYLYMTYRESLSRVVVHAWDYPEVAQILLFLWLLKKDIDVLLVVQAMRITGPSALQAPLLHALAQWASVFPLPRHASLQAAAEDRYGAIQDRTLKAGYVKVDLLLNEKNNPAFTGLLQRAARLGNYPFVMEKLVCSAFSFTAEQYMNMLITALQYAIESRSHLRVRAITFFAGGKYLSYTVACDIMDAFLKLLHHHTRPDTLLMGMNTDPVLSQYFVIAERDLKAVSRYDGDEILWIVKCMIDTMLAGDYRVQRGRVTASALKEFLRGAVVMDEEGAPFSSASRGYGSRE